MAEAVQEYHSGQQEISEQIATFHLVGGLLKWGSLAVAVLLSMLVLWFCTSAGFLAGLITGLVILAVGIYFLRSKPSAEH
ncbi:MAG: aa3-type cytochrome c oxidase subunit IV [Caulobacteraceae bacterium]|nr:aa3-type cytochrome c oxidase subunit IV [Caulobacteraceae bacterium]